jgi:hypothetical protein
MEVLLNVLGSINKPKIYGMKFFFLFGSALQRNWVKLIFLYFKVIFNILI